MNEFYAHFRGSSSRSEVLICSRNSIVFDDGASAHIGVSSLFSLVKTPVARRPASNAQRRPHVVQTKSPPPSGLGLLARLSAVASARTTAYAVAPVATCCLQPHLSAASYSGVSGSIWNSSSVLFMLSSYLFLCPPIDRSPYFSSPFRIRRGRLSSGIRTSRENHVSCHFRIISSSEGAPSFRRDSARGTCS